MCWSFELILDDPDVQKKLLKSLRSFHTAAVTEYRLPTHSEICDASIPYLDAVVEESLRLEDTVVLGHCIPEGIHIMMRHPENMVSERGMRRAWTCSILSGGLCLRIMAESS
ncbi:hypothetical protein COCMIDRAFT_41530 [Bipolaris oryzae ATCC 44560]|uniref:Uncharacterized protein n=1 Tax=Bipolaris oryzae ATCC 44560 TaxID=930090 RepID=W6YX44_COCMI|nr:uncharacterized protein COCMIDRAFT_41530 [Bipolaris oryzae ATCC 44560]EUC40094.1 hypothetical protein COCMIDRAFT_41530 [Bipolaris oryzae ATCC 44560]